MAEELERTEQERDREELVKLAFEICKHLTTLSTAGTLVVLAVYREVSFGGTLLGATLGLFGLTIIVSIAVMLLSMTYYTNKGRRDRTAVDPLLMWATAIATYIFIAGVGAFMLFLLDLPVWVLLFLIVALPILARVLPAYVRSRRA